MLTGEREVRVSIMVEFHSTLCFQPARRRMTVFTLIKVHLTRLAMIATVAGLTLSGATQEAISASAGSFRTMALTTGHPLVSTG